MPSFYGLSRPAELPAIVQRVCDVLGHGFNRTASHLLLETMAVETRLGQFRDPTPNGAGRGICQFDPIAFRDVQDRASASDILAIDAEFGINIKFLTHAQLDYSPVVSVIFCRLFYKLVKAPIPPSMSGRAEYWKRYYNTVRGKGTVEDYAKAAALVDALEGR